MYALWAIILNIASHTEPSFSTYVVDTNVSPIMNLAPVLTQVDVERIAESGYCSATTASTQTSSYMVKAEESPSTSAAAAVVGSDIGKCVRCGCTYATALQDVKLMMSKVVSRE